MAKYSFDVQESIPFGIFEKVKNYHRRIIIGISQNSHLIFLFEDEWLMQFDLL